MKIKRFNSLINESLSLNVDNLYDLFQEWVDDIEDGKISIGYYRSNKSGIIDQNDYVNTYDRFWIQFTSSVGNIPMPYEISHSKRLIDLLDSKIDLLSNYTILLADNTLSLISKEEKYTKKSIDSLKLLKKKLKSDDIYSSPIQNGYKADVSLGNESNLLEIIKNMDIVKDEFNVKYNNGHWIYITLK